MSKIITKNDIRKIVTEVINEIDYRSAALTGGANYNAKKSKETLIDNNALSKMNASADLRIPALNAAINSKFPNLVLHFVETDSSRMSYEARFAFQTVQLLNTQRLVLGGQVSLCGHDYQAGSIEYNFEQQKFYRVRFCKTGAVRRIYALDEDNDYTEDFKNFLSLVTNFLYSEEDYQHAVDVQGPTPSKPH